jgi:hypothetical protein
MPVPKGAIGPRTAFGAAGRTVGPANVDSTPDTIFGLDAAAEDGAAEDCMALEGNVDDETCVEDVVENGLEEL